MHDKEENADIPANAKLKITWAYFYEATRCHEMKITYYVIPEDYLL